ncbi:transglycosylase SLT domain-containing protein [Nocardia elegans]|uniref:Transglycosylase SLT domain-containing protein n=1 Tax=Nocardia elegans TaxID=300029 RepID=A0ABW6TPX0_9NOCA
MPADYQAGTAQLVLRPALDKAFRQQVKALLKPIDESLKVSIKPQLANGFKTQLRALVKSASENVDATVGVKVDAKSVRAQLKAQTKDLPDLRLGVELNFRRADAQLAAWRRSVERDPITLRVNTNSAVAVAQLASLRAMAERVNDQINGNSRSALASSNTALTSSQRRARGGILMRPIRAYRIQVEVDKASLAKAQSDLASIQSKLATARRAQGDAADKVTLAEARYDEVMSRGNATASARIAATQNLARARRTLEDSSRGVTKLLEDERQGHARVSEAERVAGSATSALGAAFRGFGQAALSGIQSAAKQMFSFSNIVTLAGYALVGLAAVSLVPLIGQLAQAAGVAALLPAALAGAVSVFAALKIGTLGLADAFKAAQKAEDDSQKQSKEHANKVSSAQKEARNAARSVEEAQRGVRDAERSVRDAQKESLKAQQDLNKARKEAVRDLEDINRQLARAKLDEEGAAISVAEARMELIKTMQDPNATPIDRARALHQVKVAEADQVDARTNTQRLGEDAAEANQKGVEGSDKVTAAKDRVAKAAEAEADANERVVEANQRLADANENLADAQKKLTDAINDGGDALDEFNRKLGKLSPAAQDFVKKILALKPHLVDLKNAVQDALFNNMGDTATNFVNNWLPSLKTGLSGIASEINNGVRRALADLDTDATRSKVGHIFDNVKLSIGPTIDGINNLIQGLLSLAGVGSDFLPGISNGFLGLTEKFRQWAESPEGQAKFHDFLQNALDTFHQIIDIARELGGIIKEIFKGSDETGKSQLDSLQSTFKDWRDYLGSPEGQQKLKDFFRQVNDAIKEVGQVIKDVTTFFDKLNSLWEKITGNGLIKFITSQARPLGDLAGLADSDKSWGERLGGAAAGLGQVLAGPLGGAARDKIENDTRSKKGNPPKSSGTQPGILPPTPAEPEKSTGAQPGILPPPPAADRVTTGGAQPGVLPPQPTAPKPVDQAPKIGGAQPGVLPPTPEQVAAAQNPNYQQTQQAFDAFTKSLDDKSGKVNGILDTIKTKIGELGAEADSTFNAKLVPGLDNFANKLPVVRDGVNVFTGDVEKAWKHTEDYLTDSQKRLTGDGFLEPLKRALGSLPDFFGKLVTDIGSKWGQLPSVAVGPINSLIDYWNQVGALWNKVADIVKLPDTGKWTPMEHIGAAAPGRWMGGPIHGAGGGEDDKAGQYNLSNGEHVWTKKEVDALGGHQKMYQLRKSVLKSGGQQAQGGNFAIGGGVEFGSDADRWMADVIQKAFSNATITSALRPGDSGFHGTGQAIDIDGDKPAIANWIYDQYPQSTQLIYGPGPLLYNARGYAANPANQGELRGIYAGDLAAHFDHVHWANIAPLQALSPEARKDLFSRISSRITSGGGALVESQFSAPLRALADAIPVVPGIGRMGEIPKAAAKRIADELISFVSGAAGALGGAVNYNPSAGVEQWRALAIEAMKRTGFNPDDPSQLNAMLAQIGSESGGNPNAINLWDSNAVAGHPSQGLLQTIPSTFAAYRDKSLPDNINDPLANMVAALNYYRATYGNDLTAQWGQGHGYDQGGIFKHGTIGWNLSGLPEAVLTNPQWNMFRDFINRMPGMNQQLQNIPLATQPGAGMGKNSDGQDMPLNGKVGSPERLFGDFAQQLGHNINPALPGPGVDTSEEAVKWANENPGVDTGITLANKTQQRFQNVWDTGLNDMASSFLGPLGLPDPREIPLVKGITSYGKDLDTWNKAKIANAQATQALQGAGYGSGPAGASPVGTANVVINGGTQDANGGSGAGVVYDYSTHIQITPADPNNAIAQAQRLADLRALTHTSRDG